MRRGIFVAAAALLLSGCSANSDYDQFYQVLRKDFTAIGEDRSVSREEAAALRYASMGYRVDKGGEQLLVLATDDHLSQLWTSSNHVVLKTQNGRITRSVGLPHDLYNLGPRSGDLPPLVAALKAPYTSTRIADFADIGAYSVPITCYTEAKGPETTTIFGASIATTRVNETCTSSNPNWSFVNNYWLDAKTGYVWRSRQHLHPRGELVDIEIFRPPN